jgi:hypothetical protein
MLRSKRILLGLHAAFDRFREEPDSVSQRYAFRLQFLLDWQLHRSYLACDPTARADINTLREMGRRKEHALRGRLEFDWTADDARFSRIAGELAGRFDAVENIRQVEQWGDSLPETPALSLETLVRNLPGVPPVPPSESSGWREAWHEGEVGGADVRKLLRQYLAVNLLVIGTPEECAGATAFLRESSGKAYQTPQEWAEWWRGKYYAPSSMSAWREPLLGPGSDLGSRQPANPILSRNGPHRLSP